MMQRFLNFLQYIRFKREIDESYLENWHIEYDSDNEYLDELSEMFDYEWITVEYKTLVSVLLPIVVAIFMATEAIKYSNEHDKLSEEKQKKIETILNATRETVIVRGV